MVNKENKENEKMRELKDKLKSDIMSIYAGHEDIEDGMRAAHDLLEKKVFENHKQIIIAQIGAIPRDDAGVAKVKQLVSDLKGYSF
jgi:hypothetical protein